MTIFFHNDISIFGHAYLYRTNVQYKYTNTFKYRYVLYNTQYIDNSIEKYTLQRI